MKESIKKEESIRQEEDSMKEEDSKQEESSKKDGRGKKRERLRRKSSGLKDIDIIKWLKRIVVLGIIILLVAVFSEGCDAVLEMDTKPNYPDTLQSGENSDEAEESGASLDRTQQDETEE